MADVIFANQNGKELGVLEWCEGDFTVGKSNSFELKIPMNRGIKQDYYIMIDGTEYGGIIDGVSVDTTVDYVTVSGRTWHGLLDTSILRPDNGADHLVVSGDLNTVLGDLISRQGLGMCMSAVGYQCGISASSYQFARYCTAYEGIRALLREYGCKLNISYSSSERRVMLSAVQRGEYIDDGIDGDAVNLKVDQTRPINHLIGLGSGEGAARAVVDVYADANGAVSMTQTLFGTKHKAETYEATSSEGDKLRDDCISKLAEKQSSLNSCALKDVEGSTYDIDDIVGGTSTKHGISVQTSIAQKIATLSGDRLIVETKTKAEVV